jgi:hypothetical protein
MGQERKSLREMVLDYFGFLKTAYGFQVRIVSSDRIEFMTKSCQVSISRERSDLFVDLGSLETEIIRRVTFSLYELVRAKGTAQTFEATPASTMEERVRLSAMLLARFGKAVLSGDFSVRSRILHLREVSWLTSKYRDIVVDHRYPTVDAGLRQLVREYSGKTEECKKEVWQCLEEWMQKDSGPERAFAELLVSSI